MTKIVELMMKAAKGKASQAAIEELHRKRSAGLPEAENFRSDIACRASQFGYFKWPVQISDHLPGKRVLDVGCGSGIHGIGCIALGAASYLGVDPGVKLNSDEIKNKITKKVDGKTPREAFGWTAQEISEAFGSRIRIEKGTTEDIDPAERAKQFDMITMYTVTEHLLDIEGVFAECSRLLRPEGKLIFLHDNFYSWNGHHMKPKSVSELDLNDSEQQKYADWNHLSFEPPPGHYFHRALNRIRLDDLMKITESYFQIDTWEEVENDYGRLTDEIRRKHPEYTRRELSVSKIHCVARSQSLANL